jgi:hypothetical protein
MSKVKHMIYWKQLLLDCSFCFLEESSTGAAAAAALLIVLSSFLSAGRYLEERMNVKEEEFLIYFPSSTATALLPVSAS